MGPMKKRTFLLLEILLAFTLVIACAVPLVKQPLKLYKREMAHLIEVEQERLADWTFTEIKEMFLKNEIPWGKIPKHLENTGPFPLPPVQIEIPGCKSKRVERSFRLYGKGETEGSKNALFRQVYVYVILNGTEYEFRLPMQKLSLE